jgi:hypothetical protein
MNKIEMKKEAIRRMNKLKLIDYAVDSFEKDDVLHKSDFNKGILFWLSDEEKLRVKEFEKKYKALVYHVIKRSGDLLTYLFVFDEDSSDDFDNSLSQNVVYTYIDVGSDTEWTSEFGTEYIAPSFGGVMIPSVNSTEDYKDLVTFRSFK